MTRSNQLAYLQDAKARNATLRKRKVGLKKKVKEISTLCGVEACAIIYSANSPAPDVWPSPQGVEHVINRFENMFTSEKTRKKENQESVALQEFSKAYKQLKSLQEENGVKELSIMMNNNPYSNEEWIQNQTTDHLAYLNNVVLKPHMAELERRMAELMKESNDLLNNNKE